ncbi:unnamed protein product [Triticum turgidum subsp. durum]|uniref:Secreted protein n=1 Tax=Triticum turgidum subsp. durum TaxID=4567 RepID=A0A9R0QAA2_TRITD|nr:unnamed protein product [Triticum turgidum subsp. durum]
MQGITAVNSLLWLAIQTLLLKFRKQRKLSSCSSWFLIQLSTGVCEEEQSCSQQVRSHMLLQYKLSDLGSHPSGSENIFTSS